MQANSLQLAVEWIEKLLTGTAATSVAIMAVAVLGFGMLAGRISAKRIVTVVVGCFIVFSAALISDGFLSGNDVEPAPQVPIAAPSYTPKIPVPLPYDPYAGASVPQRGSEPLPQIR